MLNAPSKSAAHKRRTANAAQYAPRPKPIAKPVARPVVDLRLRRITAQVLEDLKRPGAIPSTVIYAALEQAANGKS